MNILWEQEIMLLFLMKATHGLKQNIYWKCRKEMHCVTEQPLKFEKSQKRWKPMDNMAKNYGGLGGRS